MTELKYYTTAEYAEKIGETHEWVRKKLSRGFDLGGVDFGRGKNSRWMFTDYDVFAGKLIQHLSVKEGMSIEMAIKISERISPYLARNKGIRPSPNDEPILNDNFQLGYPRYALYSLVTSEIFLADDLKEFEKESLTIISVINLKLLAMKIDYSLG